MLRVSGQLRGLRPNSFRDRVLGFGVAVCAGFRVASAFNALGFNYLSLPNPTFL